MWRSPASIVALGILVALGVGGGEVRFNPQMDVLGLVGDEHILLRSVSPELLSLSAVLSDENAADSLSRAATRFELFRVGTVDSRSAEGSALCTSASPQRKLGQSLLHVFDFSQPSDPSGKRIRLAFRCCLLSEEEIRVSFVGARTLSSSHAPDWDTRHPLLRTSDTLPVLRAFLADERCRTDLQEPLEFLVLRDLRILPVAGDGDLAAGDTFRVIAWLGETEEEEEEAGNGDLSDDEEHVFLIRYDALSRSLVDYEYQAP